MFLPSPNGPTLKVGIYRSSSIGDVVLSTVCLDLLSKLKTNVEVVWVGKKPSIDLLKEAYPEIKFIELGKSPDLSKNSQVISGLSKVHFLVDLQSSLRSRMMSINLKKAHGQPVYHCDKAQIFRTRLIAEARMFGRNRILPNKAIHPEKRQFESMAAALIEGLKKQLPSEMIDGIDRINPKPVLPTDHDTNQRPWQKELQFGNWLAIAPGASFEAKRAPIEVFSDIISMAKHELKRKLKKKTPPFGILILGDQEDRKIGLKLLDHLGWEDPSLNLAGKLSLWETALALKDSTFLLSNDSGLGHISEAVSTPVGVLFGATVEGFGFYPHMKDSRSFSTTLGCRPCSKHGKTDCRFQDKLCYKNIPKIDASEHIAEYFFSKIHGESTGQNSGIGNANRNKNSNTAHNSSEPGNDKDQKTEKPLDKESKKSSEPNLHA